MFGISLSKPLSEAQLKNLRDHQYAASGSTLLDPIMQPFWRRTIDYIPIWVAPNLLTVIGLALNVISTSIMFVYAPDAVSEVPAWVYWLCAACLFAYQTLDALDGKQARRTGSSSPLGELFDHGCDAVSVVFLMISASIASGIGSQRFFTFFFSMSTFATFYGAHWETYVTGRLQFHKLDVTEGHFAIIASYLVSATLGVSAWISPITVPILDVSVTLSTVIIFLVMASTTWMWIQNFYVIFVNGGVGKNGSTVADTSVAFPIVPLALICTAAHIINQKSRFTLMNDAPVVYLLVFGLILAKASIRLIVAHMSRWEFHVWDTSLVGPGLLFLNQYFNEPINDYKLLHACLVFTILDLVYYSVCVCVQIAQYLDIEVFRISPVAGLKPVEPNREVNGRTPASRKSTTRASNAASANGAASLQQRSATRRSTGMRKQLSAQK